MYDKYTKADSCWNRLNSEDPLMAKLPNLIPMLQLPCNLFLAFFMLEGGSLEPSGYIAETSEHT